MSPRTLGYGFRGVSFCNFVKKVPKVGHKIELAKVKIGGVASLKLPLR